METTLDTLTVYLPHNDLKLFKELTKKFGWKIGRKNTSGIEEALDDIRQGKVYGPFNSADELLKNAEINV